ncbi:HPr family phosphocarrier protein [Aliikangiella sp. IMCC44653]
MPSIQCKVTNKKGMHARAAAQIAALAVTFDCNIELKHKATTAPANSLIKLLTLNAPQHADVVITSEGPQAEEALTALRELFEAGFGE